MPCRRPTLTGQDERPVRQGAWDVSPCHILTIPSHSQRHHPLLGSLERFSDVVRANDCVFGDVHSMGIEENCIFRVCDAMCNTSCFHCDLCLCWLPLRRVEINRRGKGSNYYAMLDVGYWDWLPLVWPAIYTIHESPNARYRTSCYILVGGSVVDTILRIHDFLLTFLC